MMLKAWNKFCSNCLVGWDEGRKKLFLWWFRDLQFRIFCRKL